MEIEYNLWLDYDVTQGKSIIDLYGDSNILRNALNELKKAGSILDGAERIVIGKIEDLPKKIKSRIKEVPEEDGFVIHRINVDLHKNESIKDECTVITSNTDSGVLYGVFAFIREVRLGKHPTLVQLIDRPRIKYRMLNHWDNLDGSIERGYAGKSLWKWNDLPQRIDSRYEDYARFCASIGINCTVINNVNSQAEILSTEYLEKVKVLASCFAKWGIKTFISVNFGSPVFLHDLDIADPFDDRVRQWWKNKAKEIWNLIPDFGGFLVKADSEQQKGPFEYGRSQSDGANMLSDAVSPYNGIIIWRAFIYGHGENDRAKKAYSIFKPLDGQFRQNVAIQVKNGPIDFQPREPVHPLFGSYEKNSLFMEFQITQEYLGQGNHLVFLAPMWKEILDFDLNGSTLNPSLLENNDYNVETVGMSLEKSKMSGIAGVSNIGNNEDWCGSLFHSANWYAFGRLCWDYTLSEEIIAREWAIMTWGKNPEILSSIMYILLNSWNACVNYMTPLGLHHIMKFNHHYGPDPACDEGTREDWKPRYYHQADKEGLGSRRDRSEGGSAACDQYRKNAADIFADIKQCPEKYLLWFHHVSWEYKLNSGLTLKEELKSNYSKGVEEAEKLREIWKKNEKLVPKILSKEKYESVLNKLDIQVEDAHEWKDVCLKYFMSFTEK